MKQFKLRKGERGNVLFLILIAVALFAALSYAVTSSSRSGGGDASEETNLVSSASVTQYPASVRTTLIRMIIGGATVDELAFNQPPYTNLDTDAADLYVAVFHPSGGGGVYSPASADVMADNQQGAWYFNGRLELEDIGVAGAGGSDIIAYLPNIKRGICEKINLELGIVTPGALTTPVLDANLDAQFKTNMLDDDGARGGSTNYLATPNDMIDDGATPNSFAGEPFGCFQNPTTLEYVYYHVLIEQ